MIRLDEYDAAWLSRATYPAHQPGPIVSVHSAFSRVPNPTDITLPSEQDWVHKRLRFVQIGKQEDRRGDETEEDGQVVGDEMFGEWHDAVLVRYRYVHRQLSLWWERGKDESDDLRV